MEKEGLVRAVDYLHEQGFRIDILVTDRHKQITKWAREDLKEADHLYDVIMYGMLQGPILYTSAYYFLALRKKLEKVAKEKDCELVSEWNHLYWSAASTPDGNADEIREKWTSVNNHIHNVHRGHGKIFKKCAHPRLRGRQKRKKWFKRLYVCKL